MQNAVDFQDGTRAKMINDLEFEDVGLNPTLLGWVRGLTQLSLMILYEEKNTCLIYHTDY